MEKYNKYIITGKYNVSENNSRIWIWRYKRRSERLSLACNFLIGIFFIFAAYIIYTSYFV